MKRTAIVAGVAIAGLSIVGCTRDAADSPDSPISPSSVQRLAIENIAASASADDRQGVRKDGAAPPANGGPRISASGNQRVINGGTLNVAIAGDAPFNTVFVFVGGRSVGIVGETSGAIGGYYEIRLPASQTSANVLLTFPQEVPLSEFDLQFAVAAPSGSVGPYVGLTTTVTQVGTGDVQVTLSWDADSDVDLHVVAPGGDEVYYGRPESPSGGELDLDSNAGCEIDGVRNENITWPAGRAPRGPYIVRVDYWSNCGVGRTNYTVRINNGGAVQIVSGSFTGSGDEGGAGSGRTVASFERSSGPTAAAQPTLGRVLGLSKSLSAPGK